MLYPKDQAMSSAKMVRARIVPKRRNPILAVMLTFMLGFGWCACAGAAQIYADRVAATVNGDVILESEVKEQKHPFVRKNFAMPLGVVPSGKIPTEKEILDELVVIRLLEQEAAKKSIQMTDQGLDAAIKSLRERNQLSQDKFIMFLAANGLNYADYRKMMKRQMVVSALINREVAQKANVSEKEAQEYFKAHKGRIDEQYDKLLDRLNPSADAQEERKPEVPTHKEVYVGGQLRLKQIVLRIQNPDNKKEKEKVIETVRKIYHEIKTGADFGQLAKRYSQDSTASRGGDLGTLDFKDMNKHMQTIVEQMKVGEVAPPLTTKNSLIILNLAEGKNRKVKKIPIPAAERKKMERQIDEMYERRKQERERAKTETRTSRRSEREAPSRSDKNRENKGTTNKTENDLGILSEQEKKEYEKERDKIMDLLRSQKLQDTMKEWIQGLKKNSIIEVRL